MRLAATFGDFWDARSIDREPSTHGGREAAVTAMIAADDAGDDPLADRREDREAAAARERKAKVAKLNSQTANAMEVVRAQQAAKERGAFELLVLSLALHRDHVQVPTKRLPSSPHRISCRSLCCPVRGSLDEGAARCR